MRYDAQYGWEKMVTTLISRQAGISLMWGLGNFSQLDIFGIEVLVIDASSDG